MGGYRPKRYSNAQLDAYVRMYDAMYSKQGETSMATKAAAKKSDAAMFKYIDRNGIEQEIDLSKVRNLDETDYAESNQLYPNAEQCFLHNPSRSEGTVDAEGRESVLNANVMIVNATWMRSREKRYGNYFIVQAFHPGKVNPETGHTGEITIPVGGIAGETIAGLANIDIQTGQPNGKPAEFPVWAKFEFVAQGDFDGYFACNPAVKQADVIEAE